jgi:hypothetical protein
MNDKCFEIGIIQAFLDGETSPDLSFKISGHVADCDNCARALAEAEEESSLVFSMLDREFNSMVPTQRLWTSINETIAYQKSHTTFWEKIRASLSTLIANPSLTVAASVLLVFGIFAAVWNLKPTTPTSVNGPFVVNTGSQDTPGLPSIGSVAITDDPGMLQGQRTPLEVKASNLPPEKLRKLVTNANFKPSNEQPRAQYLVSRADEYLPGEESYVRTIADLKQNVDGQKDRIMNPSSRIAYERDMAVVNDAIKKMKEVVKKNPKNQSAKQVLYSSYQNKIDLLNSVVEREELMVSLR